VRRRAHILQEEITSLVKESRPSVPSGREASEALSRRGLGRAVEELAAENGRTLRELEESAKPSIAILPIGPASTTTAKCRYAGIFASSRSRRRGPTA
jgi:hypothetical protein